MRTFMKKVWPLLAIVAILASLGIFYAVTLTRDDNLGIVEKNLFEDVEIQGNTGSRMAFDGSRVSSWSISNKNAETVARFKEETEINALLFNEVGYNIRKYSVYFENGAKWELCYRQNEMGINKLATFYPVKTRALKFVVEDFKNIARIADIRAFRLEPRTRTAPFRVTSYITPASLNDYNPETGTSETVDARCFDVVTDVQFIAYGRFDSDGTVYKENCAENLSVLKQMIGLRDVNIYVTIFPPLKSTMADVLRNHMDTAVSEVVATVESADVDGADFDWEYPANSEEYALYSKFLVKLKRELKKTDKILSVALSPWGVGLSKEAVEAIDLVQIMAYDLFDRNGDNNSYSGSAESAVGYFLNKNFRPEQLNLGISYYGRPSDAAAKWYNFNDPNFTRDEYIMFEKGVYFNTPTTVRDRTVYAILRGIGGIMTFSQDEDVKMDDPLSLTAQIGKAIRHYSVTEGTK